MPDNSDVAAPESEVAAPEDGGDAVVTPDPAAEAGAPATSLLSGMKTSLRWIGN